MKTPLSLTLIISMTISITTLGQKFSTQSGYESYFVENYNNLDQIEGIWTKITKGKMNNSDQQIGEESKLTVAIIFEGLNLKGEKYYGIYHLMNGKYDPTMAKGKFIKDINITSKYCYQDNTKHDVNVKVQNNCFYLRKGENEFQFSIKLSDSGSVSLVLEMEFYKNFPFDGDINN